MMATVHGTRETIGVLIPAYNARYSVRDVVQRAVEFGMQVLVVDDGSTDNTGEEALEGGAMLVRHERNRGKGAGLATGAKKLLEDGVDGIITLDADGQHLPEEIPKLLGAVTGAEEAPDIVLGTRDHLFAEMSKLRRNSNRISSRLISIAAGVPLGDIQTGFRYYSRRVLEDVGFPGTGFEAESAIVVSAARRGFSITSVPVELGFADGRGTSHYRPLADSVRIALAVIRALLLRSRGTTSRET